MNNVSKNRIMREFEDFPKNAENSELNVILVDNDLYHWKGLLNGPQDTCYAGGKFQIDIQIPTDYPYKPPKMKFDTKVWHPNISSQTGAICLDILKGEWSPALSIRTALLSLQALMCAPEPNDPQDAVVATQYIKNQEEFQKTAKQIFNFREWTNKYAKGNPYDDKIQKLLEMGFDEQKSLSALQKFGGDETKALNFLLEQ